MKRFRLVAVILVSLVLAACPTVGTNTASDETLGDWFSGLVNPDRRANDAQALVDSAPCADPETQFEAARVLEDGADVEPDPIRAYAWYAVAAARGYEPAAASRDTLAATLSAYQLSEAGRIASTWPPSSCDGQTAGG